MRLQDKVIIVTGSTSGIGRAIAVRAVEEGARVLVHGIERREGEDVVAKLGASAALHLDDLVDPESPARIAAAAFDRTANCGSRSSRATSGIADRSRHRPTASQTASLSGSSRLATASRQ